MGMYTLFQVLTLENWADGIARHVLSKQPAMVLFFVLFLMFTTFGIMNLVVGVIVENTLSASRNNEEKIKKMQEKERTRVLQHLRDIFLIADEDGSGTLTLELPFPLGRRARSSAGLKRGFACLRDLERCVREGERETLSTEDVERRGSFCTGALSP